MSDRRVVCWFSCGATSAVATHLALSDFADHEDVRVVYIDTRSEHEDNRRFLADCEAWLGHSIEIIGSSEYRDIWDVFERTRWLVGPAGARCTVELKKRMRFQYERPDDIQVFGFDHNERERAERFRLTTPEVDLRTPLIDRRLSKRDCFRILTEAGVQLPAMYRLGYDNANCIGCVKGGQGYWNRIRRDFPAVFNRMANLEREIGAAICKSYARDGIRKAVYLDELHPDAGKAEPAESIVCGLDCVQLDLDL